MNTVLKGWQLLKAIADGEIKEGTKIKFDGGNILPTKIYTFKNECFVTDKDDCITDEFTDRQYAESTFELISEPIEEINIQGIEEFEIAGCNIKFNDTFISTESLVNDMQLDKINQLIKAIKQLDNKIKEKE